MTWSTHDDAHLRAWLHDEAPDHAPTAILDATFERTRALPHGAVRTRQRAPRLALLLAAGLALAFLVGGAVFIVLSQPPRVTPTSLAQPRLLGEFLWSGGFALDVDVPPPGAVDAATAIQPTIDPSIAPYLGPADPPIFGRLRCTAPGLCGPQVASMMRPADAGTDDTWSVWIVEYPESGAYRVIGAWDGHLFTGWDGDDLQSCSLDEVGTEPGCTADSFQEPIELPADVRSALAIWGQVLSDVEHEYTTRRDDNGPYWPRDGVDPQAVARTLVDQPTVVEAVQVSIGCQRTTCPAGIVTGPGDQRTVAIVVIDDGARWVIVDAATGEVLADDRTPAEP